MIHAPHGKFGTFNLCLKDSSRKDASFKFYVPTIFAGIDAYNGGDKAATILIRSPEIREQTFIVQPGELMRIRTGWRDPSSAVQFEFDNGIGLLFDNLAYE
jgi:hypothetical protein